MPSSGWSSTSSDGNAGGPCAGSQRHRPEAADADVAVEQFLVAEAIDQVDAEHVRPVGVRFADQRIEAVGGQEVVLRQRIGRAVAVSGPAPLFRRAPRAASGTPAVACQRCTRELALREQGVGRQPRDRLQAVDPLGDVQQDDRAGGHGVVGRRGGHHAVRAGHGRASQTPTGFSVLLP